MGEWGRTRVGLGEADRGSDWGGRIGEVGVGSDKVAGKISQVSL